MAQTTIKPVNIYFNLLVNVEKVKETKAGVSQVGLKDAQSTGNVQFESEESLYEWCDKNPELGEHFRKLYEAAKKKL